MVECRALNTEASGSSPLISIKYFDLLCIDYYKNNSDIFSASEHFTYILAQIEKYIILYNLDTKRVDRVIKYREYLLQYFKLFNINI